MFLNINNKTMNRASGGKFITIYPRNKNDFKFYIQNLYQILKPFEGPYILSDRRYKDCKVLYYRFGTMQAYNKLDFTGQQFSH
jgi:hypothetical protein